MENMENVLKEIQLGDVEVVDCVRGVKLNMDCGSTGTRAMRVNNQDPVSSKVIALESEYSVVEDCDITSVRSKSKTIYDNLELVINKTAREQDSIEEDKMDTNELFNNLHIVKGRIAKDVALVPEKINSDQAKSSQEAVYVNIVANTAINLLTSVCEKGKLMRGYAVDLTVALRADDTSSTRRMENFKNRLAGEYTVEFPRLGVTVIFQFTGDKIFIENESKAVVRYFVTANHKEMENYKRAILIDGGGSSVDMSFLLDGTIVDKGDHTGKYGGNRMVESIKERYLANHDAEIPSSSMVEEALPTGLLQDGNTFIDITEDIKAVKIEYAKRIIKDIDIVCQKAEVKSKQLNLILTSGGMFGNSVNEQTKVPSLYKFIELIFKKKNETIDVQHIVEKYPVVWGLMFFRLSLDEV